MALSNLKISTKIVLILAVLGIAFLLTGAFSARQMSVIDDAYNDLVDGNAIAQTQLVRTNRTMAYLGMQTYQIIVETDDALIQKIAAQMLDNEKQFNSLMDSTIKAAPQHTKELEGLRAEYRKVYTAAQSVAALASKNQNVEAAAIARDTFAPLIAEAAKKFVSFTDTIMNETNAEATTLSDETDTVIATTVWSTIGILVLTFAGALFFVSRGITRPLIQSASEMKSLADGHLDVTVTGTGRGDEIGAMARNLEVFKSNALTTRRLEEEQQQQAQRAAEDKRRLMHELADTFESKVKSVVESVSAAATQMQANASAMTSSSDVVSRQGVDASSAASHTNMR